MIFYNLNRVLCKTKNIATNEKTLAITRTSPACEENCVAHTEKFDEKKTTLFLDSDRMSCKPRAIHIGTNEILRW